MHTANLIQSLTIFMENVFGILCSRWKCNKSENNFETLNVNARNDNIYSKRERERKKPPTKRCVTFCMNWIHCNTLAAVPCRSNKKDSVDHEFTSHCFNAFFLRFFTQMLHITTHLSYAIVTFCCDKCVFVKVWINSYSCSLFLHLKGVTNDNIKKGNSTKCQDSFRSLWC